MLRPNAKAFIGAIAALGLAEILSGGMQWHAVDLQRFICYYLISIIASVLKVSLPGVTGTMSVNFLFVLVGIIELSVPETLLIGCTANIIQCIWRTRSKPTSAQVLFNVTNVAIAIALASSVYHARFLRGPNFSEPLLVALVACVYFVANTFPVAAIISITESKSFRKTWQACYFWSFPYYMIGAGIAQILHIANQHFGWQISLFILPLVYVIFRSYRQYLGRLEGEKLHAEQVAALHLRTIEALSLAIDAKDHNTHEHLRRVQVYALEIGKELGLTEDEIAALRAASLLHDIGKLAVPEHIISKPGKLTPEEFEKMKIHPLVGAEILEEVDFPYPVVPIVRAHHEKWDGSGYPFGLRGEDIPIGARILSAVDCLDALASDRQYRRALPLDDAMAKVKSEAGTSFDPRVIEVLARRYLELEETVRKMPVGKRKELSTRLRIQNGQAPAAGFEVNQASPASGQKNEPLFFLESIAAARQEVQALFEITQAIGNSLSLGETLSVLAVRLKHIVPYDGIAIYVIKEDKLVPEYVSGDDFRLFSSLAIPMGDGLSGWVAENNKAIINGNPSVEPSYLNDATKFSVLRSALSVPLTGLNGVIGALTLYRSEKDSFTKDNLRVLLALTSKVSLAIENALKYRQVESCATTDYLTNLPNARSLFLHLDGEINRSKRSGGPLTVLVGDLDGFKQINDRFGHLEGNRVLQLVSIAFKENCREYDYVARMGGDEFVIVIPGLSGDKLHERIAQLENAVRVTGMAVCGESLLSLSIGAAIYPEDGNDAEGLLSAADRRMYSTKQLHKRMDLVPNAPAKPWVGAVQ
ncbi:MAG TPA: HD domain-containing phosphohydrolase [Bryobacteraceae bacterium]|nr:HD domain-containing phosphohydrolase [Bryobacteraceae bacterium]